MTALRQKNADFILVIVIEIVYNRIQYFNPNGI
jgi:hypothetical protein